VSVSGASVNGVAGNWPVAERKFNINLPELDGGTVDGPVRMMAPATTAGGIT
jgi:hypothetical protein